MLPFIIMPLGSLFVVFESIAFDKMFFLCVFLNPKALIFSYLSTKTYVVGTHQGASNVYPQHMFSWRNSKKF